MTTIERKTVAPTRRRSAGPGPQSDTRPDRRTGSRKGRKEPEDPPAKADGTGTGEKKPGRTRRKADPAESGARKAKERTPKPRTPERRTLKPTKVRPEAEPSKARQPQTRSRPRPRPSSGRPRAPFVLLILCLLGGALVSLLVLNTVLARDAYTLSALEGSERQLTQQKQALIEEIAREESPGRLALKARNQGMVQPSELAFVDPGNGRVTGGKKRPVPSAAAAAAAAAGVIGVPGAIVPGDGIPGWTGLTENEPAEPAGRPQQNGRNTPDGQNEPERTP
ncbi:hypothetical protein ABGB12_09150 [Actinocorallia sp. B10E7]|uniref:hypothetical protein n=1 Tax=Actinocorallia sp. B10E7 TaxID=3153558 RepID=UPI00325E1A37